MFRLLQAPIFPGESDLDQLTKILDVLGAPTEKDWPVSATCREFQNLGDLRRGILQNAETLPDYVRFKPCAGIPLKQIFIAAEDELLELLARCFRYNPVERCTCSEVSLARDIRVSDGDGETYGLWESPFHFFRLFK